MIPNSLAHLLDNPGLGDVVIGTMHDIDLFDIPTLSPHANCHATDSGKKVQSKLPPTSLGRRDVENIGAVLVERGVYRETGRASPSMTRSIFSAHCSRWVRRTLGSFAYSFINMPPFS